MAAEIFHKLVSDRIPEIIEAEGKICRYKYLSDEDYLRLLDEKLDNYYARLK